MNEFKLETWLADRASEDHELGIVFLRDFEGGWMVANEEPSDLTTGYGYTLASACADWDKKNPGRRLPVVMVYNNPETHGTLRKDQVP